MPPPRRPGPASVAPNDPWLAAARKLVAERRFAEAIAPMSRAAAAQPRNASILADLGQVCLQAGQPAQAIGPLRRAIALQPHAAQAHLRLGEALEMTGDRNAAVGAYAEAARLQPSLTDAHYRLGVAFEAQGRTGLAIGAFRHAARTASQAPARQISEAKALILEGREPEAADLLRKALARAPDNAVALGLLAGVLAGLGAFEESAACLEAGLVQSPTTVGAYYGIVRSRRITPADEPLMRRMDAALELEGVSDSERASLQLARGKAFDDLGQFDKAMQAFDAASAIRARSVPFRLDAFERWADSILDMFSAERVARAIEGASQDRTPVFVLGMPRSGTTLCEQILCSHPDVAGPGELTFWNIRARTLQRTGPGSLEGGFVGQAATDYLAELRTHSATAARVVDKDPWNFFWIGLIHMVFPRAAIIHCRRSPIDTALSIHQTDFAAWRAFPTGGEDLVGYFKVYRRMMAHWRRVLPPGRMLEVDYETLTSQPEAEIPRIIDYVGLDWRDSCLRPQDTARMVRTPSRWQVRQPINRGSVERWRRYEPYLGPLAALVDLKD